MTGPAPLERKHINALVGLALLIAGAAFALGVGITRLIRGESPLFAGMEVVVIAVLLGIGVFLSQPWDTVGRALDIVLDHVPGLHKEGQ